MAAECPGDALGLTLADGEGLSCACPANVPTRAYLFGTGRYTSDSSICLAAAHAGETKLEAGGEVTLYTGGGCPAFKSTAQNGLISSGWGAYDRTFAFETPLPDCSLQAARARPIQN